MHSSVWVQLSLVGKLTAIITQAQFVGRESTNEMNHAIDWVSMSIVLPDDDNNNNAHHHDRTRCCVSISDAHGHLIDSDYVWYELLWECTPIALSSPNLFISVPALPEWVIIIIIIVVIVDVLTSVSFACLCI